MMGVFVAATLAIANSPHRRVCLAQNIPPADLQRDRNAEQLSRPLQIENAQASIAKATVSGPQFAASILFVGVEDPTHPVAKRLRTEYRLNDVVNGETSEFRKRLKLRHWVHSRWQIDNDQNFNGDVFAICIVATQVV